MRNIYKDLSSNRRLLAVLIDPGKQDEKELEERIQIINDGRVTHVFVGGSEVNDEATEYCVQFLKSNCNLPIVLFPGDLNQISESADALLFLTLISGRNPDYLIGKQVEAASKLRGSALEIIPTGYILVENGKETSVERVSKTKPLPTLDKNKIVDTAKAGALLGLKCIYLEAGSGALKPISPELIRAVKIDTEIPIIVGGGVRTKSQLEAAYNAGANMVVVGTAFEEDSMAFDYLGHPGSQFLRTK